MREVRKLVRKEYFPRHIYESFKRADRAEWHKVGTKYEGVRNVANLMEGENFDFRVGYGVLVDIWDYLNIRYGLPRARDKMEEISNSVKDKDSILGLEGKTEGELARASLEEDENKFLNPWS